MASRQDVAAAYWGYLILPDRSPSPLLEQLLLAIASYINRHVAPWDISSLTPAKLGNYYRLVGGDYDSLFLDAPHASVSFIYRSLGCFHTLQPGRNPYAPPSIPALTPLGFVRWQTVQLLLDPNEHVPFLQESVKRFDLLNPTDGEAFPSILPKSALPVKPDPDMAAWHARVSKKLLCEVQGYQQRALPQQKPMAALSDADESSRPTSAGSLSIESQSLIDAASYLQQPRTYHIPPPLASKFANSPPVHLDPLRSRSCNGPWPPLQRRSSYPGSRASTGQNLPRSAQPSNAYHPSPRSRPRVHVRTPSTVSTSSCSSDCSSSTTSSTSLGPQHPRTVLRSSTRPRGNTDPESSAALQRPKSYPDVPGSLQYPRKSTDPTVASVNHDLNVRW